MKYLFFSAILFTWCIASAQSDTGKKASVAKTTTLTLTAGQAQAMFNAGTDRRIYNEAGLPVDSAEAFKLVKTFEYTLGLGQINHQGPYKRMLFKARPDRDKLTDPIIKKMLAPKGAKLQEGIELDLTPFGKRIDAAKVQGKAIVLIFWCAGCFGGSKPDAYADINEVIARYVEDKKFEVYAVTHLPYDEATNALKKNPILNAHQLFDSESTTQAYETANRPVIVVTDKNHKITYAITNNAQITPRVLNGLLKEL